MALCIRQCISLTFFWTTLLVRIHRHECLTLWPVDSCPGNLSEVEAATFRLNCSDVKEFRNVYHCLPLSNLSLLIEFCYDGLSGLVEKGNCMVLENQNLNNHPCNHFTNGCPNGPYFPKEMFKFPGCIHINKQNRCYLADPRCLHTISLADATSTPTVNTMENKTVLVDATTMPTINAMENSIERTNVLIPVFLTLALESIVVFIGLVTYMWMRHRNRKRERKRNDDSLNESEENDLLRNKEDDLRNENNLIESEENYSLRREESHPTNENERNSYSSEKMHDTKVDGMTAIFNKKGSSIRFNNLRLDLIKEIPDRELNSLKDSLTVMTSMTLSTENVTTKEEFFTFLLKEGIFKERNVIMMQYLMRCIKRQDLELKCKEYAMEDKEALCYFEETSITEDGFTHVKVHVVGDIERFPDMDALLATVAAIAGCKKSSINVVGLHPVASFIIIILMKEEFAQTLRQKGPHGLKNLLKYNVDWIEIKNEVIHIQGQPNNLDMEAQSSYKSQVRNVLAGPCSNLFRRILRKHVIEEEFISRIQKINTQLMPLLTVEQQSVLYPERGSFSGSYKHLDMPLMYILFQRICFIEPHKKGWGNSPDQSDTSLAASIERIMDIQREYCRDAHSSLTQSEFDRIIKRILKLTGNIEEALESPRKDTDGKEKDIRDRGEMEGQFEKEENVLEKLREPDDLDMEAQSSYKSQVRNVLAGPCSNLFRRILRKHVTEEDFTSRIQKSKTHLLPFLTVEQQSVLYPKKGSFSGSYKHLDVPLMYILFQRICFIEHHQQGWGNSPDESDTSLAACIERIMEIQREYCSDAHPSLTQTEFDRIIKRMLQLSENIEEALESPRKDTYGKEKDIEYKEKIEGLFEKDENILEKFRDVSISQYLSPTVVSTSSITVPRLDSVYHISCVTADRLWVSGDRHILQINSCGHEIPKKRTEIDEYPLGRSHTVTYDGKLLCIESNDRVLKMTSDGTITTLIEAEWRGLCCIHSSRINGNILVGYIHGIMRYDCRGQLISDYMEDWRHDFHYPTYITENMNGDIWVSDRIKRAVVVADKSGRHRFDYTGQQSQSDFDYGFEPRGICTDILGHVLVCDFPNSSVHLLDQDGHFLRLLLTREHGLRLPMALCVDDKHNLYLGQLDSNTITVYKYLQEAEKNTPLMESK